MSTALAWLAEPLAYAFLQRSLAAAVMVAIVCALVGSFVVLRGMAFMGDALAHTILPGIAIGYLVGRGARGPLFAWGLGTAVVAALAIGAIARRARLREDTAIGVLFAGFFALGIALISSTGGYAVDLAHFLFGDVLGVGRTDLVRTAVFGLGILAVLAVFYRGFLILSFDPVFAATLRLPTRPLHDLLLVLVAVTVVVALQTVGIAMTVAMLVTPPATARLVCRRLPAMMATAAGFGAVSAVAGIYLSYYAGVASGAAIVLVATLLFLAVFGLTGLRRRDPPRSPPHQGQPTTRGQPRR